MLLFLQKDFNQDILLRGNNYLRLLIYHFLMYEYPLSTIHKRIVESWLSKKDKPLFIKGGDGCGKSCLSKNLLKNYHIHGGKRK